MSRADPSHVSRWLRGLVAGLTVVLYAGPGLAQVPIPVQEQVRVFNSLPAAQRQSIIRELQRSLPPAQREAIVNSLLGTGEGPQTELDPEAAAALGRALEGTTEDAELAVEPRLEPRDTLVIRFDLADDAPVLSGGGLQARDDFQERLARGNPYELDGSGMLYLPGVPAIALAGLNVDEATVRVQADPALRPFTVVLTFLPLMPVGTEALEPFGYDLFERQPSTFAPADIPVPVEYVMGPGDTVNIQLFGSQNIEQFLPVTREGAINFPGIGPIVVSGLTFAEMRDTINERVRQQMIGVSASITLGELRSIQVFVLGEVVRPGSYTVSGLATMTNALFAGGGVKRIGSLRNVALRRDGNTVSTLDLYDLLLRGDTRGDARLLPGDAIFVPPIGATVTVDGAIRRPAIYEIKNEQSVADLVALAGGLNPNANRGAVKIERVVPNSGTTVQDLDLGGDGARTVVRDGDIVRVPANLQQFQNSVRLAGNVFQPGPYQWSAGMRLRDLLPGPELVKPMSDLGYVLIRRERSPNVAIEVHSADLRAAWASPTAAANVPLEPRDTVYVFNIETGREEVLGPLLDELEAQVAPNMPLPVVRVEGEVRAPGEYPIEPGMRVSDLLRAGGGLSEAAYANEAEITRYAVVNGEYRTTELIGVSLTAVLRGDAAADIALTPYDYLSVKEVSRWRTEASVSIRGEVTFPGDYPIRQGETLASVLMRAGGLTELAFPDGAIFTRVESRAREQELLDQLARRVERDLAALSVSDPGTADAISAGQSLIAQLRSTVATGRLVIRLGDLVANRLDADLSLKDGDQLLVPDARQEVSVVGEVQYATAHLFEPGLSRDDYIAKSGGLTARADQRRIYVVRASGAVEASSGRWFTRSSGEIRQGDAIVVPLDVDQPLARWSAITQIIYNLAIAAAAIQSF